VTEDEIDRRVGVVEKVLGDLEKAAPK